MVHVCGPLSFLLIFTACQEEVEGHKAAQNAGGLLRQGPHQVGPGGPSNWCAGITAQYLNSKLKVASWHKIIRLEGGGLCPRRAQQSCHANTRPGSRGTRKPRLVALPFGAREL